jgi:ABC-type transporter Mla subunit MlaD
MTYLFGMTGEQEHNQGIIDQRIGYGIMALLALIILAVTLICIDRIKNPAETRIIAFEQVGNLKIDDPVKLRGMDAGIIKDIQWRSDKILVFIETKSPISLHEGYHIDDRDIGMMGDRILMISDGDPAKPSIPKADTLTGEFHNGVSETVGLAWKLREIVDSFVVLSAKLLRATPESPSFVARIGEVVTTADSATGSLTKTMERINDHFALTVDSIDRLVGSLSDFSRSARAALPRYSSAADTAIKNFSKSMATIDALTDTFSTYANRLQQTGALKRSDGGETVREKITVINNAITHLKDGLLKFQVYLK